MQSFSPSIRERIVDRERSAFASSKTRKLVYRQQPSREREWVNNIKTLLITPTIPKKEATKCNLFSSNT